MKYSKTDLEYLSGEKFSNGYKMHLGNNTLWDRVSIINKIVKGKVVLHIGCCDHIPLIEKKIADNIWLHGLLEKNCSRVVGVDINSEAVDYVNNNKLSKEKVFCSDVTKPGGLDCIPELKYDYIILGEMLEHVDNPVEFLSQLTRNVKLLSCSKNVKYIITVPNAYLLLKTLKNKYECINSDHRYWFTPFTVAKVMIRANIIPTDYFFASYGVGGNGKNMFSEMFYSKLELLRGVPSKHNSIFGDSIIVIGKNTI